MQPLRFLLTTYPTPTLPGERGGGNARVARGRALPPHLPISRPKIQLHTSTDIHLRWANAHGFRAAGVVEKIGGCERVLAQHELPFIIRWDATRVSRYAHSERS
jgi:hypothetical protein